MLVFIMFIFMSVGCSNETENITGPDNFNPDFVFVPEFTSLSALANDLPNINNVIATEHTLYFTSANNLRKDQLFQSTSIFIINHDENILTYLSDYSVAQPPSGAEGGSMLINAMHIDIDNNIWIVETNSFVTFDFPSGFDTDNADVSEIWEYQRPLDTSYFIKKLSNTGAELLSINITSELSIIQDRINSFSLYTDYADNIYIAAGQSVFIFNNKGSKQFTLNIAGFINQNSFIKLSNGRTALYSWNNNRTKWILQEIDLQNKAWGETIILPDNTQNVFAGFDGYLFLMNDGMNLIAIDEKTNEEIIILRWIDSGVFPSGLSNVHFLSDDRIMFTTTVWNFDETG